ncbi:TetR/AcrR family transcriptional regulator [Arenibaculum sp.]|uniref:TetR/AcrR family transcriptional regulator n=1 Tax=Arenibaculum sp. TaxID=2865862 RepID=UPI002E1319E2|nr:TetR/AcrR family transcriptional regulator [Arenibaculum sp.]
MAERAARERRRANDPEGMRRRLLDAAAAAFQSRGYHSTSTQEVMREAGVTGGALHHHFPTKKALGLAVIRERVAAAVEETWIAPFASAPTAAEGIRTVFGRILDGLNRRGTVVGCPLNNLALELSLADTDFQSALGAVFEEWQAAVARKLHAERVAGTGADEAEALAALIVASYSGAMAMAKAAQDTAPLEACARQLARLLDEPARRA